ncbi:MAG TPA: LysM domain-containing protein [Candidatus Sulfotelmatobacter sp.]|nr:LysM domain-containing protein [Candidatus Sulfotelmatobacter sp.]
MLRTTKRQTHPLMTEKRPANPLPNTPRHGSRHGHKVQDDETLESVAQQYGITTKQLIHHNFGTDDTGEINWYLREYVGCNLPTQDRKNWRFSDSAAPGIIYIPQEMLRLDPIYVYGEVDDPVDLTVPGLPDFLASSKFTHEFKIPPTGKPKDLGYLMALAKISVNGELKQTGHGGIVKVSLKKDQVKLAIESKIIDDTKFTFAGKIDDKKKLEPLVDAIAKGSRNDFFKALAKQFEATIKTTYKWDHLTVEPEIGGEISQTPLILRVTGGYEDEIVLLNARFKGKFAVTMGLNVGLSAKGWEWVAQNVGRPVLRFFIDKAGPALAELGEWLVSEAVLTAGAIAIGTVAGTVALTSLMAWIVQDANRTGELKGLATWYISAYTARVFDRPYQRSSQFIIGDVKLRDQLIAFGEKDALLDARAALARNDSPASAGTEQEALDAYRMLLLAENQMSEDRARVSLRVALEKKSEQLAGL